MSKVKSCEPGSGPKRLFARALSPVGLDRAFSAKHPGTLRLIYRPALQGGGLLSLAIPSILRPRQTIGQFWLFVWRRGVNHALIESNDYGQIRPAVKQDNVSVIKGCEQAAFLYNVPLFTFRRFVLKPIILAFATLFMLAPVANAAGVGVLDTGMVLTESNAGRLYAKTSEARFKPQLQELQKLEGEARAMQEKLQKDGPTLSSDQLKARQLELQRKVEDMQLKGRQYQVERTEADNAEREKLRPKLQSAVEKVAAEMKLEVVFDRQMAIYSSPRVDITRKVIERLNQAK